jgi:hypothetical protein
MPASDLNGFEGARWAIPFRVVARKPSFYDPGLTTHNRASESPERIYPVLYIKNRAYRNRADLFVSGVRVIDRLPADLLGHSRIHPPESVSIILAKHVTSAMLRR